MAKEAEKLKIFRQLSIFSVLFNVVLSVFCFYILSKQDYFNYNYENKIKIKEKNKHLSLEYEYISYLEGISFKSLVELLNNSEPVTKKITISDLALSTLISKYGVDYNNLLNNRNMIIFKTYGRSVYIFQGITNLEKEQIGEFCLKNKFPFNTEKLFSILEEKFFLQKFHEKTALCRDDSVEMKELFSSFVRRREFYSLDNLLLKNSINFSKDKLIQLIIEGGWNNFKKIDFQCRKTGSFDNTLINKFLFGCVERKSAIAAEVLINNVERSYLLKEITNQQVLLLVNLLKTNNIEDKNFIEDAICEGRFDCLHDLVNKKIICATNIEVDKKTDKQTTINEQSSYVVKDGDSLWIIAKKTGVSISDLMKFNNLKNSCIRPGRVLLLQ